MEEKEDMIDDDIDYDELADDIALWERAFLRVRGYASTSLAELGQFVEQERRAPSLAARRPIDWFTRDRPPRKKDVDTK